MNASTLGVSRALAKKGVHAVNYVISPRSLAIALGITVIEAERFIKRWFSAHPGFKTWHNRTQQDLFTSRAISNKFGFTKYYFDRIDNLLPQAVAWQPQSTVAIVINKGMLNIQKDMKEDVQLLLQVHDSLTMQMDTSKCRSLIFPLKKALSILFPIAIL